MLTGWYVLAPVAVGMGVAAGALFFVYVSPGKPNVGVISLPYAVITEGSANGISEYIEYARRDDSVKAVVIKLNTPGGGASASERLYIETRNLRQEKPVVIVMGDLVASGGYMMSMGASYTYAQTSSLVGNVGVISGSGPLIPDLPDETTVFSSPRKLDGGTRREWIGIVDLLKESFAQMVVAERGDKLRISREELIEGRLYAGMVAVRLGLADEIGGDSDAIRKAAELAGISNYGFVDVNFEVMRERLQKLEQVVPRGRVGSRRCPGLAFEKLQRRRGRPHGGRGQQQDIDATSAARADGLRRSWIGWGRPFPRIAPGYTPPQYLLPVRGPWSVD